MAKADGVPIALGAIRMAVRRRTLAVSLVGALLLASLLALAFTARTASAFTPHSPILIDGDAAFTSANGVSTGNGTLANPYLIQGWSVDAGTADGIVVRNTTAAFVVRDVLVSSGSYLYDGIVLDNTSWGVVQNATVTQDATGIVVRNSVHVSLYANTVLLNTWDGIDIAGSSDVFVNGNGATYNSDGLTVKDSSGVRLAGNSLWKNLQDGAILTRLTNLSMYGGMSTANGWYGVELAFAENVTVASNQFSSNGRAGLSISSSDNLRVSSNVFFSNVGAGVQLIGVTNATVDSNNLSPAGASGIVVESARAVRVTRNSVSQANYSGILLARVDDLTVGSNTLSNNDVGVGGVNVSALQMTSNVIVTNTEEGVSFVGSTNVTLDGNNVSQNGDGVFIDSSAGGILRRNVLWQNGYGVQMFRSTGFVIANNTFLENVPQTYDDGQGENQWDAGYPAGGNYWSDYSGIDLCSGANQSICIDPDGIGDTSYPVGAGLVDRYPLMRMPGSSPRLPIASFVVLPPQGNTTTVFTFDASSSYDLQDAAGTLLVRWDWEGDGFWDTQWTTNRTATHRFPAPGTYSVRLEVLDLSGLKSDKVETVTVESPAPLIPPQVVNLLPAFVLVGSLGVLAAATVYRWYRARRPALGQPAWRLPPGPRR